MFENILKGTKTKKSRVKKSKGAVTVADRNKWKKDVGWYHKKVGKPN